MSRLVVAPEAVQARITVEDQHDLIEKVAAPLVELGLVEPDFPEFVEKREKTFPTGLPLPGVGVAIPHTDPEHVCQDAVAVATLTRPVTFEVLGSPGQTVDVDTVFMLALKGSEKQLEMLQSVIGCVQDMEALAAIRAAGTDEELLEDVQRILA